MLEAKSLRKVVVPPTLLQNPSPANLQSNRLSIHVNGDGSSCWIYIASGCRVYKVEVSMEDCSVNWGKENLLIPLHAQIMHSSIVNRCPHRSEIQSMVLAETESTTPASGRNEVVAAANQTCCKLSLCNSSVMTPTGRRRRSSCRPARVAVQQQPLQGCREYIPDPLPVLLSPPLQPPRPVESTTTFTTFLF